MQAGASADGLCSDAAALAARRHAARVAGAGGSRRVRTRSQSSGVSESAPLLVALLSITATWLAALVLFAPGALAQEVLDDPLRTTEGARDGAEEPTPVEEAPAADTGEQPAAGPPPGAEPDVGLDQLLRLPNSLDFKEERRGGGGAADWRRRFADSERHVAEAHANLEQAEGAMAEAGASGSGQWQMAPPGQQANAADNGPLSFKLREDLRRARTALEDAERQHRALIVEADLAGVPEDWRVTAVQ